MNNKTMFELYEEKEYWYQMLLVAEGNWDRMEYIMNKIAELSKEMASRKEKKV